ncbi:MAG: hypothetical protein HGB08_03475 [Candidatus Moranbacteria bacterium]|nr:hypothetical protein [Candidatus Moranbacteria bacterium]
MNIVDYYALILVPIALFVFVIYLAYYYLSTNQNKFWDDWVAKTLWMWLPFYALQRLIKEVILKKK